MHMSIKRKVAVAVAGLALAAGGGLAYAASQDSTDQKEFLDNAAKRLDVSPNELGSALRGAYADQLDEAVKDGKLTQEQADRIKERIQRSGGLPPFGGPPGHLGGHGHGGPFHALDAAADYLGLTEAQLHDRLESGKSLADVAKDEGKSVDGLEQAIKDDIKAKLDDAVEDDRLTREQADRIQEKLNSRVADLVAGERPDRGGFGGHGPGAGGGPWGPHPPDGGPWDRDSDNGSSDGSSSSVTPGGSSSS